LRIELKQHTGKDIRLSEAAMAMMPDMEKWTAPSLRGTQEKWVPFHGHLAKHELFATECIHSNKDWSEYQRFIALFVYRAHCKGELFNNVQKPLMGAAFWKDPRGAFMPNGVMEKAILAYRIQTKSALITTSHRAIPPRVLACDNRNLVRSIVDRSVSLLGLAETAWTDLQRQPGQCIGKISKAVQDTPGFGPTWAKMLTGSIDNAYPAMRLLEEQCDVGIGAVQPLRSLLESIESAGSGSLTEDSGLKIRGAR
jgi:hypothetical protein